MANQKAAEAEAPATNYGIRTKDYIAALERELADPRKEDTEEHEAQIGAELATAKKVLEAELKAAAEAQE